MTSDHRPPLSVLGFWDRKQNGRLAVDGPDGRPVAYITTHAFSVSRFEVTDACGNPLCAGTKESRHCEARDPRGALLVTYTTGWRTGVATLANGKALSIPGAWLHADWRAIAEDGSVALSSALAPRPLRSMFHPDAWLVAVHDATLGLSEMVAIVQLHRIAVQATRRIWMNSPTLTSG